MGAAPGHYDARKRSRHGAAWAAQTRSTVPARALNSTGLMRNASNPAAEGEPLRSSNALAVRATIGVGRPAARGLEPPQTARGLVPVETRHLKIHQDDVERTRLERRDRRGETQRLLAVERANDLEAQAAQRFLGNEGVDVVVLGDKGAADDGEGGEARRSRTRGGSEGPTPRARTGSARGPA